MRENLASHTFPRPLSLNRCGSKLFHSELCRPVSCHLRPIPSANISFPRKGTQLSNTRLIQMNFHMLGQTGYKLLHLHTLPQLLKGVGLVPANPPVKCNLLVSNQGRLLKSVRVRHNLIGRQKTTFLTASVASNAAYIS